MPKVVIPIELDLPEGNPLLSTNAGEAQRALAEVENAIDSRLSDHFGQSIEAKAIWIYPGTHRSTITDAE